MKCISKKYRCILMLALMAYVIKNIFVGTDFDEGYGVVVGYRLAQGDKLFLEMWEPHQLSAIFTAFWIKIFLLFTNDVAGLYLYLRVIYFLIHGTVSYFVYDTFKKCICQDQKAVAFLLSLVFFVSCPKSIYIPEYSNLHIWFFSTLCMSILQYSRKDLRKKTKYFFLLLAGVALTCDILTYPSMIILYFIFLGLLWVRSKDLIHCLIFTAPCLLGSVLLLSYIFSYMSLKQLMEVVPYILSDGSHQTTLGNKISGWILDAYQIAGILLLTGVISALLTTAYSRLKKRKNFSIENFLIIDFLLQVGYQFYCWFTSDFGAFYPHITQWFLLLSGIYCYYKNGKKEKNSLFLIYISIAGYLGVMLLSNWSPVFLTPFLILGGLGGLKCLGYYLETQKNALKGKIIPALCGLLIINNIFGYCWLIIGGETNHSSILTVGGINKEGVRKGIFTNYISAYCYNENEKVWSEAVPEDSNCFYVGVNQFYYMLGNCRIAAPSTISTPSYDEALLKYWEINPNRYPDVVVIESWFGDMQAAEEGTFIREWLDKEFCASEVEQYSYITVFKK